MCDECYGDGQVIYGPDHPVVKLGFPQGVFECPMCGGTGRLYEDQENYPARIPKHDHRVSGDAFEMKNCGSCKYWGGKDDNPKTSTSDKGPFGHASCRRIQELQDIRISKIGSETAVVESDSDSRATLLTQESFSCNLWERVD